MEQSAGRSERERERKKKRESAPPPPSTQARARTIYKNGDKMPRWKKKKSSNFVDEERTLFFPLCVKSFIHSPTQVKLFLTTMDPFGILPKNPLFFLTGQRQKTLKKEGQKVSNRIFFDVGFRVFKSLLSSRIIFRRRGPTTFNKKKDMQIFRLILYIRDQTKLKHRIN